MEASDRKYIFVLNPIAGGKRKARVPVQIDRFCDRAKCNFRIYKTTGHNDLNNLRKVFEVFAPDAVVAIGGDGTVNLVGNLLVYTDIPLGIIPLGSGNGLAKDLGLPLDIEEAFERIHRFETKYIDSLNVNGINCFHLSDLGYNARIVRRFAYGKLRGKISYFWYGISEFLRFKPFAFELKTKIESYTGQAFMLIISNANKFGTNISVNPLGEIDDGWFEVSIFKPFPKFRVPYIGYHLLKSNIHQTPFYKVVRTRKAVIKNISGEPLHIDGEPVSLAQEIQVEVMSKSLRVIM